MYRVKTFDVTRKKSALYEYCEQVTRNCKNLYNVGNFYIRQLMTGLRKDPAERQENEKEVISVVNKYLTENKLTCEKWFIGWVDLINVLTHSSNTDYKSLPADVAQNTIREICGNWTKYFSSKKEYAKHPELFTGAPRIPKYLRGEQHTTVLSKRTCHIKKNENGKHYLTFPKTKAKLWAGDFLTEDMELVEVKIKPKTDRYTVSVTVNVPQEEHHPDPDRIIGIDPGVNNFAAITNNMGLPSILVKGRVLKSLNQWYNKENARLVSILTKGHDSTDRPKNSKRISTMWEKRSRVISDTLHKIALSVIRYCTEHRVGTVVIGHTKQQKTETNIGHVNNQNFVNIPFAGFNRILGYLAEEYNIRVIEREESYTSKASFLDMDDIPVYKKDDETVHKFSGKRIKRGLYRSKDGTLLNADVNGSLNIIRKEFPHAFDRITDFSYIRQTEVWNPAGFDRAGTPKTKKVSGMPNPATV